MCVHRSTPGRPDACRGYVDECMRGRTDMRGISRPVGQGAMSACVAVAQPLDFPFDAPRASCGAESVSEAVCAALRVSRPESPHPLILNITSTNLCTWKLLYLDFERVQVIQAMCLVYSCLSTGPVIKCIALVLTTSNWTLRLHCSYITRTTFLRMVIWTAAHFSD